MDLTKIIETTKALLKNHQHEEAQQYLKEHAYLHTFNQTLDDIYISLFEPPAELKKALSGCLKDLQSTDICIRKKAANELNRRARGNWSTANKAWLTDTRTIASLTQALEQETDEKIVITLINTLGSLSQRYDYNDIRIFNSLKPLYKHPAINVRVEACTKSLQFNHPETWETICQILENKTTKNTNAALGLFIARHGGIVPDNLADKLPALIERAYIKEKNLDAKDNLLLSLGKVGNNETIAFIKKEILQNKKDNLLIDSANQTINNISERLMRQIV